MKIVRFFFQGDELHLAHIAPTLGKGQNLTFSEYGHVVAYQIKGNDTCRGGGGGLGGLGAKYCYHVAAFMIPFNVLCNMVANILLADPPPPPPPPPNGVGWGKNSTFSEYGHVAYQIEGNVTSRGGGSACKIFASMLLHL